MRSTFLALGDNSTDEVVARVETCVFWWFWTFTTISFVCGILASVSVSSHQPDNLLQFSSVLPKKVPSHRRKAAEYCRLGGGPDRGSQRTSRKRLRHRSLLHCGRTQCSRSDHRHVFLGDGRQPMHVPQGYLWLPDRWVWVPIPSLRATNWLWWYFLRQLPVVFMPRVGGKRRM